MNLLCPRSSSSLELRACGLWLWKALLLPVNWRDYWSKEASCRWHQLSQIGLTQELVHFFFKGQESSYLGLQEPLVYSASLAGKAALGKMQMNGHDGGPIKASWLNKDDLWIWPDGQSELTSSPIGCSSRPLRVSSSLSSDEFFCPLSESTLLWMELSFGGYPSLPARLPRWLRR